MRPAARYESKMARQSKREVAETLLWSVNKVLNEASSMVTMPPIRSEPCSGMRGASWNVGRLIKPALNPEEPIPGAACP